MTSFTYRNLIQKQMKLKMTFDSLVFLAQIKLPGDLMCIKQKFKLGCQTFTAGC